MPLLEILIPPVLDENGDPVPGATGSGYTGGTTTAITTYSDESLTTPHTWPVVADSSGLFPSVYVPSGIYKFVIKKSDGSTIRTVDDVNTLIGGVDNGVLELTGGTVTGETTFTGPLLNTRAASANFYTFYRTDADAAITAGLTFRHFGGSSDYIAVTAVENDGTIGDQLGRFDPDGTASPATGTLITREKGDLRYALAASDQGLKENIADMGDVGTIIDALRPVTFTWIEDADDPKPAGMQYGFIAQEVAAVFPSGALNSGTSIDVLNLLGLLLKEAQSLRARVTALEP